VARLAAGFHTPISALLAKRGFRRRDRSRRSDMQKLTGKLEAKEPPAGLGADE
jgi:hypothetical protein